MTCIALVGAGAMGSALGAGYREAGHRVVTSIAGRSERTARLVEAAGIELVADAVAVADVVLSVVPPGMATAAARDIAVAAKHAGRQPLVVDLNAVAPGTVHEVAATLAGEDCPFVDGSISGGPPSAGSTTRVYLSGERASDVPPNQRMDVVVLDAPVGAASALKMCTASMYKGTRALVMQALLTADANGVREQFLADTARAWLDDVPGWPYGVAVAASKAWRFVDEMHEIARTQADAGLPAELFEGIAAAYERAATTALGQVAPEDVATDIDADEVVRGLRAD